MTEATFKLMGVQRSGTTWTQNILRNNFPNADLTTQDPIMKHDTYHPNHPPDWRFVFLVRHPHSWPLSHIRWKRTDDADPNWFANNTEGDSGFRPSHIAKWLAQIYGPHVRSYTQNALQNPKATLTRYEDLLTNPQTVLEQLADAWNLTLTDNLDIPDPGGVVPKGFGYTTHDNAEQYMIDYYRNGDVYEDIPDGFLTTYQRRLHKWYWGPILRQTGYNARNVPADPMLSAKNPNLAPGESTSSIGDLGIETPK